MVKKDGRKTQSQAFKGREGSPVLSAEPRESRSRDEEEERKREGNRGTLIHCIRGGQLVPLVQASHGERERTLTDAWMETRRSERERDESKEEESRTGTQTERPKEERRF